MNPQINISNSDAKDILETLDALYSSQSKYDLLSQTSCGSKLDEARDELLYAEMGARDVLKHFKNKGISINSNV